VLEATVRAVKDCGYIFGRSTRRFAPSVASRTALSLLSLLLYGKWRRFCRW